MNKEAYKNRTPLEKVEYLESQVEEQRKKDNSIFSKLETIKCKNQILDQMILQTRFETYVNSTELTTNDKTNYRDLLEEVSIKLEIGDYE